MPINILMPALSPTMEKGNLAKWLKKEGDAVKTGDVIAEIETDKATMEYEAVDDGTLAKIVVPEGTQDVAVNQLIAVMAQEGEDVKAAAAAAGKGAAAPPPKAAAPAPAAAAAPAAAPAPQAKAPPPPVASAAPRPVPAAPVTNGHAGGRVFSSPLARRIAKDAGIDIGRVQGTGPHGRVIARDVESARSGGGLKAPAARGAAGGAAPMIAPSMTDKQILALYEPGSYEIVPHDGMRRTIAQRLTASVQTIPHFYLTVDCDIGKLLRRAKRSMRWRRRAKTASRAYKLSVNDFVIKALAVALQRVPDANVSWTEGGMLKHKHSDIGVAVAMPNGLITPIIRNAEIKSLATISNEMRDFAVRARDRKLKPHEYQGGSSAVSNLGMYGIKDFHRRDQSAACDDPRGRHRRGTRGGARRQDCRRPYHELHDVVRSSRCRRRARRDPDRRLQVAGRKSGDDAGVTPIR